MIRFPCRRHNEFATKAGPSEIATLQSPQLNLTRHCRKPLIGNREDQSKTYALINALTGLMKAR
jgi:hypothetical protein